MDLPQAVYTDNSDYLALGLTRYLLQKYEHTNIPLSSAHTPTFLQQTRYLHLPGPAQLQRNNKRLGRPYTTATLLKKRANLKMSKKYLDKIV